MHCGWSILLKEKKNIIPHTHVSSSSSLQNNIKRGWTEHHIKQNVFIENIQSELFTNRCCEPVGQMKRIIYQTHLNHCRQQTFSYVDFHNIYFAAVSCLASLPMLECFRFYIFNWTIGNQNFLIGKYVDANSVCNHAVLFNYT